MDDAGASNHVRGNCLKPILTLTTIVALTITLLAPAVPTQAYGLNGCIPLMSYQTGSGEPYDVPLLGIGGIKQGELSVMIYARDNSDEVLSDGGLSGSSGYYVTGFSIPNCNRMAVQFKDCLLDGLPDVDVIVCYQQFELQEWLFGGGCDIGTLNLHDCRGIPPAVNCVSTSPAVESKTCGAVGIDCITGLVLAIGASTNRTTQWQFNFSMGGIAHNPETHTGPLFVHKQDPDDLLPPGGHAAAYLWANGRLIAEFSGYAC